MTLGLIATVFALNLLILGHALSGGFTPLHGTEEPPPPPPPPPPPAPPAGDLEAGEQLNAALGCVGCHGRSAGRAAPAYLDIADTYRADDAALERLVRKVTQGSAGECGVVTRPAEAPPREADVRQAVRWVLSLTSESVERAEVR